MTLKEISKSLKGTVSKEERFFSSKEYEIDLVTPLITKGLFFIKKTLKRGNS